MSRSCILFYSRPRFYNYYLYYSFVEVNGPPRRASDCDLQYAASSVGRNLERSEIVSLIRLLFKKVTYVKLSLFPAPVVPIGGRSPETRMSSPDMESFALWDRDTTRRILIGSSFICSCSKWIFQGMIPKCLMELPRLVLLASIGLSIRTSLRRVILREISKNSKRMYVL